MTVRGIKIFIIFTLALYFTVMSINNITDYRTGWLYLSLVTSMQSVPEPSVLWRSLGQGASTFAYWILILWQVATALVLWVGGGLMVREVKSHENQFADAKSIALVGLAMHFALFMLGFMVFADEWFYMFETPATIVGIKALLLSVLAVTTMYFLSSNANEHIRQRERDLR